MKTLVFVLSEQLGWGTYAGNLRAAAAQRDDFTAVFHAHVFPKWMRPWLHWVNSYKSPLGKMKPTIDPILGAQLHLGSWWKQVQQDPTIHAVHAASHILAGPLQATAARIPYSVALDITRPLSEANYAAASWSRGDYNREARLFQNAAHCFPMSSWAAQSLMTDSACHQDKITVMPPSVDLAKFPWAARIPKAKMKIAFIGADFARKGGERLRTWMAGPLADICELHVASPDFDRDMSHPNIKFYGRVENQEVVQTLLPQMDVLCLPTLQDMSPFVAIEASASGIPIVISDIGGISDLVDHETSGFLVDKSDDAGFINRLTSLAENPDMRAEMGRRARLRAEAKFDATRNFNALFDQMLAF
ncbi:glycosyltransferase family 4 protein [Aestuariibius sp. HNIBRBA575]|uniref:glycosyltransferase family 4 protein n=1 Tax=Aestuariibius sp. HNIBRBA575 TaxID=3233343 RepID=UPI0034A2CDAB